MASSSHLSLSQIARSGHAGAEQQHRGGLGNSLRLLEGLAELRDADACVFQEDSTMDGNQGLGYEGIRIRQLLIKIEIELLGEHLRFCNDTQGGQTRHRFCYAANPPDTWNVRLVRERVADDRLGAQHLNVVGKLGRLSTGWLEQTGGSR